jgi:hypothetical protein
MAVDLAVPDIALELGAAARKLLLAEGGTQLCRQAEAEPGRRESVGELLAPLGLWDIDPREDLDQAMAAAEVVRASGALALPYPVVGRLLARDGRWLAVVRDTRSPVRIEHGDLTTTWLLAGLDGTATAPGVLARTPGQVLAPFVARGDAGQSVDGVPPGDVALWLTLDSFWLLGAAQAALDLTVRHVLARQQFGRPLAAFQAVRLRTAECVTLLEGLRTLGQFTLWHRFERPVDAMADALALRSVALEAANATFWAAHQFHGAGGFSKEHDVTLLHRHAQGHIRLPADYEEVGRLLTLEVERAGFETLYGRFQGPVEEVRG